MEKRSIKRATLGRLPTYLEYLRSSSESEAVSAGSIAHALGYGEVLVRRDLNLVCSEGRPKIGYPRKALIYDLETVLSVSGNIPAILVGVGKLGRALMNYRGFRQYGFSIAAGFDPDPGKQDAENEDCPVYPMELLPDFCREHGVSIGIITAPGSAAQQVCDLLTENGVTAIWNFAPCRLRVPKNVTMRQENLALSLAHLVRCANEAKASCEVCDDV